MRAMVMIGEYVFTTAKGRDMASEMYDSVEKGVVEGCGHMAEENPKGL